MQEQTTTTWPPSHRGPGPIRIAVVIGATLILLGSAAAALAHGGGWPGGGGGGASVAGPITITAVSGSNVSLKTDDGWTRTIAITSSTTIIKGSATIAVGDLKVGDEVRLAQTRNADGTYTVTAIRVVLPQVAGTVTAKSGSNLTLLQRDGATITVHTSSATTYQVPGVTDPGLDDITVGMTVVAVGTTRTDGSLDAQTVSGFGGWGFFGPRGWHGWDAFPKPTASPSAQSSTS
jgi:hypothetical protein